MNPKIIISLVLLFVLIIIGMFTFSFLKKHDLATTPEPVATSTDTNVGPYATITRVDAKHFFQDGLHTLVGEITLPTPCDLLEATASVAESMPEQVTIDFNIINNADNCTQVLTTQRFKVEVTASSEAKFTARLMGRPIELNLVPPTPGETPEEFELFIKG